MALRISSTRMACLCRHHFLAASQSLGRKHARIACLFPRSKGISHRRSLAVLSMIQTAKRANFIAIASSDQSSTVASLLEKLRSRQARDDAKPFTKVEQSKEVVKSVEPLIVSFKELGLSDELMTAVHELKLVEATEVQSLGIPSILKGKSVVIASHTGSGKTLAYMLPLVQAIRRDETVFGRTLKPKRPCALVLCPTRELAEQVFHVAKSVCHHARFRPVMISGGGRMRPQEDMLNSPVDMVIGTPGRLLMHIDDGNMVYGDIKYVVLDEADTMFDQGFGPEVRKILAPLKNRASQIGDKGFQTVLVTATISKAVQKLLDEEFPDLKHIHTSTLHKKVASAKHQFIRLSGTENKLEALLQVLEPSVKKGNHIMVFSNTLGSCRAVDHFLRENNIFTVNYHGEVPAEERTENLHKFKAASFSSGVPTLVCTDLAARGLDLHVDHVIMFDFPLNSIDYLHRTGRTARMGAKGKVTSLVTKRDQTLAGQIEEAISRGETLEALTSNGEKLEGMKRKTAVEKQKQKLKADKKFGLKGVRPQKESSKSLRSSKADQRRSGTKVFSGKVLSKSSAPSLINKSTKSMSSKRNFSSPRALKAR